MSLADRRSVARVGPDQGVRGWCPGQRVTGGSAGSPPATLAGDQRTRAARCCPWVILPGCGWPVRE